jgi:hypothetical protein
MCKNNLDTKIYVGTWCHEEEKMVRAFFGWYFNKSLKDAVTYPQNLTNDQWFERLTKFHKEVWPSYKGEYI